MNAHFVLDARTATPHFPGIGRYVGNLARALLPLLGPNERLTVLHSPPFPIALPLSDAVRTIPLAVSPFSLRQQWIIPRLLREGPSTIDHRPSTIDHGQSSIVYHSPYIAMPFLPSVPALLTVYDLIPLRYPEHSTRRARLFVRWMTRMALRAARQVIAISEFTRRDYLAEFGLSPERISAIPLAADPAFTPQPPEALAAVRQRYGLPEKYVLYLGSNKPHKNLVRLVEAWQAAHSKWQVANTRLVIAGAWDPRYPEAQERARALATSNPASSFQLPIWLGPVPEVDLPALYTAATVFVFPSLYEGFGLPVLEAMACGTPVVCSNTSSLPEVAGASQPAALLIDPLDTEALTDAMHRVLLSPDLRVSLHEGGLARAREFTWVRTAAQTLDIYRRFLTS